MLQKRLLGMIEKMYSFPLTFETWITTVMGIIFVRIFLEQYSNNLDKHYVLIDISTIVQYSASFIAILLAVTAVMLFITKKSLREVASLTLYSFPIIWTAPIFDLIFSGGKGYNIHYLFLSGRDLVMAFFTEFWTTTADGMTYGIRVEIAIILIASFITIHLITRKASRALLGTVLIWLSIFIVDCIPSFLGLFQGGSVSTFIQDSIVNSNIIGNSVFSAQLGFARLFDIGFNSLMTQANLLIAFVAIILICIFGYKEKAKVLLRNARPERILHYVLLIIMGVILGGGKVFLQSWVNVLSLFMTMIAFALAWCSAVCVNDVYDVSIDEISNATRPLPRKLFSKDEFRSLARILLIIALVTAYSASLYGLFFVALYSFVFYLYSAEPLRLRRHFVSGALVIGFASISALLSGFFISIRTHELFAFPPLGILILIILFGFSSMVKDIKDYEGDRANGVRTLPVLMGLRKSKVAIALVVSISLIGVSYFLYDWLIIGAAVVASVLIWIVLLAKVYREKNFFLIYLAFLIFAGTVMLVG